MAKIRKDSYGITLAMEKVGAVGLAWNPALTRREWPEAYCCRPCRRLIVPFPEEE